MIILFFKKFYIDDARKIGRLDASGLNDLEGLKKGKQRIKGDRGCSLQNLELQISGNCVKKKPTFICREMGVYIVLWKHYH